MVCSMGSCQLAWLLTAPWQGQTRRRWCGSGAEKRRRDGWQAEVTGHEAATWICIEMSKLPKNYTSQHVNAKKRQSCPSGLPELQSQWTNWTLPVWKIAVPRPPQKISCVANGWFPVSGAIFKNPSVISRDDSHEALLLRKTASSDTNTFNWVVVNIKFGWRHEWHS